MKATELMIGDWVKIGENDKYSGSIGKIVMLRYHRQDDGAYFFVFVTGDKGFCTIEVFNEDIEPIPLTPEILEKNGWRSRMNGTGEFYLEKPLVNAAIVTKNTIGFQMNHGPFNGLSIHYVHNLQHALRDCGIEKEIEL